MELTNEFTVDVPVDEAWAVLTDVERIAPCMPGAKLESAVGDEYRGVVKVKVGPVTAEYKGTASFVEKDEVSHRAVLRAEGRETRGQGNASATISATLEASGSATHVSVVTDLSITGRVAQFGRGVMADVSAKLLRQFVDSLESTVLAAGRADEKPAAEAVSGTPAPGTGEESAAPAPAAAPETRTAPETSTVPAREVVPVNMVRVVGPVLAKRLAPLAALVVLGMLWRRMRRRRRAA